VDLEQHVGRGGVEATLVLVVLHHSLGEVETVTECVTKIHEESD
jgi:hypothetical protein